MPAERDIYNVTRLNREVRSVLESGFPLIWLEAELTNLARPGSGHWYFSLKDSHALVRCAMFRNRNMLLSFSPDNGDQVLVRARVGLYEPRGDFQLIIEHMEEAGEGALRRQFELLKHKLDQQGLFNAALKKPLPKLARTIGIVTSPTGAAIHDVLTTLTRRFPLLKVIIYPTSVQGKSATQEIVTAITNADQRNECDVIIITRGGGSLEDLWCFNEEAVAHAIHACHLPVVSAIGHDIDFSIADFVADVRAATPTAAAELVSPETNEIFARLLHTLNRLTHITQSCIRQQALQLTSLNKRLLHPGRKIQETAQLIDKLSIRLGHSASRVLKNNKLLFENLKQRQKQLSPLPRLQQVSTQITALTQRLTTAQHNLISGKQLKLVNASTTLDAISPLATLQRGYAIVHKVDSTKILHSTQTLRKHDTLVTRLGKGNFISTVKEVNHDK